jgi:hypothetical protein
VESQDQQVQFLRRSGQVAPSLAHSGLIIIQVMEGTVYRITAKSIDEVERGEPRAEPASPRVTPDEFSNAAAVGEAPVEIQESLRSFREDYPYSDRVAFVMMQFGQTRAHNEIMEAIREGMKARGITGVRADHKHYHDDLFYNVLTYMHGCGIGMAVYDRIEAETYNPNVALEVGYWSATCSLCGSPCACSRIERLRSFKRI